jgi:NhaA family Na+:H+ antiporter
VSDVSRRTPSRVRAIIIDPVLGFIRAETTGGIVLLAATLAALLWANSPVRDSYDAAWETRISIGGGPLELTGSLRHLVDDGLMTLFFFVVGLEIKRELVVGDLRERRAAALPLVAALGGVLLPAAIFVSVAGAGPARAGWGIPIATDIAFAVGVLALLGRRVPPGCKLLLLTIAIVDDVIAILVIAVFYSVAPSPAWLSLGVAGTAVVVLLRRLGTSHIWPYALVGLVTWYAVYRSGVHATMAGVVLALLTPALPVRGRDVMGLLQHRLHPVSAFAVVPLFALANAGVDLRGGALEDATTSRVAWAVAAGLVLGKLLGIGAATTLAVRFRIGVLPPGMAQRDVWGIAALAGIGFTVSLFITGLAYGDPALAEEATIGIFVGSLLSGLAGAALLSRGRRPDLLPRPGPAVTCPDDDRDVPLIGRAGA